MSLARALLLENMNSKTVIALKGPTEDEDYIFDVNLSSAANPKLLHHDGSIWDNPMEFNPQRFIDKKYTPFEFAPFGGGARRCARLLPKGAGDRPTVCEGLGGDLRDRGLSEKPRGLTRRRRQSARV